MGATVRVPRLALRLSDAGARQLAGAALQVMSEQAQAGVSAEGGGFAGHPGPVDLHHRANVFAQVVTQALRVSFLDNRASALQAIFNFAGISLLFWPRFVELAQPILAAELRLVEE